MPGKIKGDEDNRGDEIHCNGDALIDVISDPAIDVDDNDYQLRRSCDQIILLMQN
jgi:hypothetical protein